MESIGRPSTGTILVEGAFFEDRSINARHFLWAPVQMLLTLKKRTPVGMGPRTAPQEITLDSRVKSSFVAGRMGDPPPDVCLDNPDGAEVRICHVRIKARVFSVSGGRID